jgi:Tol biopolymer transport system component
VAFYSHADNLVTGDTNDDVDIFVHDRLSGQTTRVSVAPDGAEANDDSFEPAISADGTHVAFYSFASNLVLDDTNGMSDIFVHDGYTGVATRVSLASDGSEANGSSYRPVISAEGEIVAFESRADNLVTDDGNGLDDVFVHDCGSGVTTRVSVASDGTEASGSSRDPSISCDGLSVAFSSQAENLVAGDTNEMSDVFVRDLTDTGTTTRVSVAWDGSQANAVSGTPVISCDGNYIAFSSGADNLVPNDTNGVSDVFVHDRASGSTYRVSLAPDGNEANGNSYNSAISGNGRYVAFQSYADNLVAGDTNGRPDIFVHDRDTGETIRVNVDSDGNESSGSGSEPAISVDGNYVVFRSYADDLVSDDTNQDVDIFVRGPLVETGILTVEINIAWQRDPNQLNPDAGMLQVAILTTATFDAAEVDPASVLFGPWQAAPVRSRMRDFDADVDEDLLLFFETAETGIICGQLEATLSAETLAGEQIVGTDTVVPVACH